jgi:hypothetical protein
MSDSSDDDDDSSSAGSDGPSYMPPAAGKGGGGGGGGLGSFMKADKKKRGDLTQFGCFDEDDDNTVVQKMKGIMALREQLGIDDDVQFNAEQDKKDIERKRIAAMTSDERMAYEEESSGDAMSKIKAKHAEKMAERQKEAADKKAAEDAIFMKEEAERLEDERIYAEEQAQEQAELVAEQEAASGGKKKKKKKSKDAEEEEEPEAEVKPKKKKKSKVSLVKVSSTVSFVGVFVGGREGSLDGALECALDGAFEPAHVVAP